MKAKPQIRAWQSWLGYTLPPGSCLYQDKGFQGFFLAGRHDRPTQEKTAWRRTHAP